MGLRRDEKVARDRDMLLSEATSEYARQVRASQAIDFRQSLRDFF
uniref:Uncharacterized protein n=1 Tax=Utricularia reniformis TaxID=192314 RepID=A0A1Y0B3W0_9LAMI|nr:hypothetical protein AEK19_MT1982 [Utricularia reniformis]ART32145.1 hypothetical protein AEK19_MT1982 [Utricularia reniformis]